MYQFFSFCSRVSLIQSMVAAKHNHTTKYSVPPLARHIIFHSSLTPSVKYMRAALLQASIDYLINDLYLFSPFINSSETWYLKVHCQIQ